MKEPPLTSSAIAGIVNDANLDPSEAMRDLGYAPLGVRAVVSYLAGLGHTDILHVTGGDGAGAATRAQCFRSPWDASRSPISGNWRARTATSRTSRPRASTSSSSAILSW